ncbi:hypothetical protein HK405_002203, partial [Cladochytrium tenue]
MPPSSSLAATLPPASPNAANAANHARLDEWVATVLEICGSRGDGSPSGVPALSAAAVRADLTRSNSLEDTIDRVLAGCLLPGAIAGEDADHPPPALPAKSPPPPKQQLPGVRNGLLTPQPLDSDSD